ncbi:PD40 domain-containing protein [candidate division KSB1 bacterium]|nr:PD40 domain-containing protein [candidate division KSB1 bacterium]
MKVKFIIFLYLILILTIFSESVDAQSFGKNKVQYTNFNWQFIQSEHFDVYFTNGGAEIAEFVADVAERSYFSIKRDFRFELADRISIVVYNSHNDFEQTNVSLGPPEESVGGFTEFFKNRVVIPYQGDWESLRHVVHHELTHAVMLQMVYGSGTQSIIVGMARLQLPLWLIEGLAEYESRGWDVESDMYMRDAALNGYVPPVDRLYGFMAYKGGQSVLYYLAEKYGNEKIGEILGKIKINRNVDIGLKKAIGVDVKDLTKRWHLHLKRQYWPDISGRLEPEEIAKKLTDHEKDKNFINNGPALSPKGDKIVFLSDRSDYFDIYLMSAIDGRILKKLVSGQQTSNLEELHWLQSGLSWSPDGQYVAFSAKAGEEDALHIVDVRRAKITRSLKFGIDGIFTPSWSPKGDEIAFVGIQNGFGDIYAVNLETEKLRRITNDKFSDIEPSWSPDGSKLIFVSDRGEHTSTEYDEQFRIQDIDFRNLDIYIIEADGSHIERITDTPELEHYPVFSPTGDKFAFTSDACGIPNIYIYDLQTNERYPITNIITGAFHLSWGGEDGSKLAFASFYNAGYDIYLMKNPFSIKPGEISLEKTNFIKKKEEGKIDVSITDKADFLREEDADAKDTEENKYKQIVFNSDFMKGDIKQREKTEKEVFLDSTDYKFSSGEYKINKYKVKFSPDIVYGNASYDQIFGMQGNTQIALSDVLGNHRINLYLLLLSDIRNSNYMVTYYYLPRRIDVGFGLYHFAYYIPTSWFDWVRDRIYGGNLMLSMPFSRYRRIDFGMNFLAIDREFLTWAIPTFRRRVLISSLNLVNDTVLWGEIGPVNGGRSSIGVHYSPKINNDGLEFITFKADWRKYFKISNEYSFMTRFAGGFSEGEHKQNFFVGGIDNWLNYKFRDGIRVNYLEDIYFSSFEMPLRGADFYELVGTRYLLTNLEFRFPLIRYFILGWPLPIGFQNIRGALFADLGSAWYDDESYQPFLKTGSGGVRLNPEYIMMGYGLGTRMNLGFFILRFDIAWTSDWTSAGSKPKAKYYFSLGAEL